MCFLLVFQFVTNILPPVVSTFISYVNVISSVVLIPGIASRGAASASVFYFWLAWFCLLLLLNQHGLLRASHWHDDSWDYLLAGSDTAFSLYHQVLFLARFSYHQTTTTQTILLLLHAYNSQIFSINNCFYLLDIHNIEPKSMHNS